MQTEKTLTEQEAIAIFGVDDEDLSEAETAPTDKDVTGDTSTVGRSKSSKKSKTAQESLEKSRKEMIVTARIQKAIANVHEARDRQQREYQEAAKVLQDRLEADRQALIQQLAEAKAENEKLNRRAETDSDTLNRRVNDLQVASIPKQGSRANVSQTSPVNPMDTVTQSAPTRLVAMEVLSSEDEQSVESDGLSYHQRWSPERRARWDEEQSAKAEREAALQRQREAEIVAAEKEEARQSKRRAQERLNNTNVDKNHPSFQNSSSNRSNPTVANGGVSDEGIKLNSTDTHTKQDDEPSKKRHKSQGKKSGKHKSSGSSSSSSSSDTSSTSGSSDSSSQSNSSTEGRHKRKNKRSKTARKVNVELAASGNTELPKCPESEPIGHARLTLMKNQFDQIAVSATLSRRKIKSCFSLIQRDQMMAMVRLQLGSERPHVQEYLRGYDPRQIFKMKRRHLFKLLFAVYQPLEVQTVKDKNQRIINEIVRLPLNLDGEWQSWFAFLAKLTKVAVANGYKDLESFKDSMTAEQSTPLLRLLLGNLRQIDKPKKFHENLYNELTGADKPTTFKAWIFYVEQEYWHYTNSIAHLKILTVDSTQSTIFQKLRTKDGKAKEDKHVKDDNPNPKSGAKSQRKQERKEKFKADTEKLLCAHCGKRHGPSVCLFANHPDANPDSGTLFLDTNIGKAYEALQYYSLVSGKKLSADHKALIADSNLVVTSNAGADKKVCVMLHNNSDVEPTLTQLTQTPLMLIHHREPAIQIQDVPTATEIVTDQEQGAAGTEEAHVVPNAQPSLRA